MKTIDVIHHQDILSELRGVWSAFGIKLVLDSNSRSEYISVNLSDG